MGIPRIHSNVLGNKERNAAYRMVALQMMIVFVVACIFMINSFAAALSAWLGGMAYAVPNLYFARRFFSTVKARDAKQIIKAFIGGELVKLLLSAFLVILIAKFWQVSFLPFFCGFLSAPMGLWLSPFFIKI